MKLLQYDFNGEQHIMSGAEARSIEALGKIETPSSPFRMRLMESVKLMDGRPGQTDEEEALKWSKSDRPHVWHRLGGCRQGANSTMILVGMSFLSTWKIHPESVCKTCLDMCRIPEKLSNAAANSKRLRELTANLKPKVLYHTSRARVGSEPPPREPTNAQINAMERERIYAMSTPIDQRAEEWGVALNTLRKWKRKGVLSGPRHRVWNYWQQPVKNQRNQWGYPRAQAAPATRHPAAYTDPTGG